MSKFYYVSQVWLKEITPYPSERIERGVVVEHVMVQGRNEPIAVIVRQTSDQPPDPWSGGRVRVYWYLVHEDSDEKPLRTELPPAFHRDWVISSYGTSHCIKVPKWRTFASADDCDIEYRVLEWSGMLDIWEEKDLGDRFSFWSDVLGMCDHFDYETREWEGGVPGLSGEWYKVRTNDPNALKLQIAEIVKELAARPLPPPPPPKARRKSAKRKQT